VHFIHISTFSVRPSVKASVTSLTILLSLLFCFFFSLLTDHIFVDVDGLTITLKHIQSLNYNTECQCEVINVFMRLLQHRDNHSCSISGLPGSVFYSAALHSLLVGTTGKGYDFSQVQRWKATEHIAGIFEKELLFFPIHTINPRHWTLVVVYMKLKRVAYFDSMGGSGLKHIETMIRWLGDVWTEQYSNKAVSVNSIAVYGTPGYPAKLMASWWTRQDNRKDVPQQVQSLDCGIFAMLCADYISADLPLLFTQAFCNMYREQLASMMLPE
jgi:Ulp1 family protease